MLENVEKLTWMFGARTEAPNHLQLKMFSFEERATLAMTKCIIVRRRAMIHAFGEDSALAMSDQKPA